MADETFEELVARISANAFIPPPDHTGVRTVAKQVKLAKGKEFHFSATGGREVTKYPWDEWFSGNLMLLDRSSGEENDKGTITEISEKRDYEVPTQGMPPKINTAARRRYKVVQVSRHDADGNRLKDALIIKARDMTPEEKQDENMLRIEERDELKAKKLAMKTTASSNGTAQHVETLQEQDA